MYKSKLAEMVQMAIEDCITFGSGEFFGEGASVTADWEDNEKDIHVVLYQSGVVKMAYTEKGVM